MAEPISSIQEVDQYLRDLLFNIEESQNNLLGQLSPTVPDQYFQQILDILPTDIRAFIIFREPLDSGSPQEIEAVLAQFDQQMQEGYQLDRIESVGNQVVDLLNENGVTVQELEDYLNSL